MWRGLTHANAEHGDGAVSSHEISVCEQEKDSHRKNIQTKVVVHTGRIQIMWTMMVHHGAQGRTCQGGQLQP
jgi:hypothetical protein